MSKLAIICTHPTQYYSPWFTQLSRECPFEVKIFYLWDFGVTVQHDKKFETELKWDIPLLEGYSYEFVDNVSKSPGTSHFGGIDNPELASKLLEYDPAAVLCLGYAFKSFARLFFNARFSIPLFLRGDSHRIVPSRGLRGFLKRQVISRLFKSFSAFLYVGKANYDYFRYHGVSEDKLYSSPHAVDNARFMNTATTAIEEAEEWKRELGIPQQSFVFLFVGKFEEKKRPQDLLRAFSRLSLSDVVLLFVGSGELEEKLRHESADLKTVHFLPFQNQSKMPGIYSIGDVIVLPSYGPYETWGLSVNEAMCLGRPAIVSDHVGCAQDLVHHRQTGLVFKARHLDSLVSCMQEAAQDRGAVQKWGAEGKRLIAKYDYQAATEGVIGAFKQYGLKSDVA